MFNFAKKLFGSRNDRALKSLWPLVARINDLEAGIRPLTDVQLQNKTVEFKTRLSQGAVLNELLPEAFAVVREASRRILNMRHFDVQLLGGAVLHEGRIAEMKTGEGKTLVATLPVYLNALEGKGVHLVTVNDYLARRDAEWMGKLYHFLGMSTGIIVHGLKDFERQRSYQSDVTYGTNNEFGFDYLRDNMKYSLDSYVQRELHYAIVDEVDSILIDEARTPLIISGSSEDSTDLYYRIDTIIPKLVKGQIIEEKGGTKRTTNDYVIDEKARSVVLTEEGVAKVENLLSIPNLYDPQNLEIVHHVNQGLKAHTLFRLDVDYVVKDGEVLIVDEFTGRLMPGRRWSDGLHQAVEAKEKVEIENENQTLATISFQNYFRMYKKLAGMTGTADTEAAEFAKIYNLEVNIMPPNLPMVRQDSPDEIYKSVQEKFHMVVEKIQELHKLGAPILVGTTSVENSEKLSALLKRQGVTHHVLNAKHHEREAEIIAQAGRFGSVTIATNMAGRGTDILLGGNPETMARHKVDLDQEPDRYQQVLAEFRTQCEAEKQKVVGVGGLHIIGTERHEARRIDNQLRGRAGRQGDPGASLFFLSLEDDLMRIFGSERIAGMMERLGMEENEVITHPWISKAIANAQKRVEGHNFEIRKHLLDYDDVMNQQRKTVYTMRREFLAGDNLRDKVLDLTDELLTEIIEDGVPEKASREQMEAASIEEKLLKFFNLNMSLNDLKIEDWSQQNFGLALFAVIQKLYEVRETECPTEVFRHAEKVILLSTLDALWKDHLLSMDHLREGIGLRGYGQKDPLLEYKREGFAIFQNMLREFRDGVIEKVFHIRITEESQTESIPMPSRSHQPMMMGRGEVPGLRPAQAEEEPEDLVVNARAGGGVRLGPTAQPVAPEVAKVGRNDFCPCGSGKKYKKCHGQ